MRRDPAIVVIEEDVSGGAGTDGQRDAYGGVLGVTKGLIDSAVEGARSAGSPDASQLLTGVYVSY